jgi:hypothetical protein
VAPLGWECNSGAAPSKDFDILGTGSGYLDKVTA